MKKLIMILSALLCLSMLFVSCTSDQTEEPIEETTAQAETTDTTPTETPIETEPEPIPEDLKIDYEAIIAQWNEYISFEGETEDDTNTNASLSELFSYSSHQNDYSNYSEDFNVSQNGNLVLFSYHLINYGTSYDYTDSSYEDVTTHTYRYNVYDLETGKEVSQIQYTYRYYPYRNGADRYEYARVQSTPTLLSYGIIRVELTAYRYVEAVENEYGYIVTPAQWESKTTYNYYDQNGNLLVEGLETSDLTVVSESTAYQTIIRIGNSYFLAKDGEIVAKLGAEMQVRLDFGVDEYNGFQYNWTDHSIQVLDTNTNRITVNWSFDQYFNQRVGYTVSFTLGNGNVLFQKYCYEIKDEGVQFGSDSFVPLQTLLNVKTGEVTNVTPTCEIDGVTYEYVIVSLINNANNQGTGLAMKDGNYQLAEIILIADGIAAPKSTLVILDSELQVVATLDHFLQDQAAIYGVLENGNLLVYAASGSYYAIDVDGNDAEKVQLSVAPNHVVLRIAGGFLATDGILYNDNLKPLVNVYQKYGEYLPSADGLKVWSNEDRCYYYLSINEAGELVTQNTPEAGTYLSSFSYGDCTVYKSVNTNYWTGSSGTYMFTVYNAQGQTVKTLYGDSCTISNGMLKLTSGSTSTYYILK